MYWVIWALAALLLPPETGALISHGAISDWPKKETYEHYTSISMILKEITKLPVGLKCQDLELLLLECWEL